MTYLLRGFALLLLGCGARTELGVRTATSEAGAPSTVCATIRESFCSAWTLGPAAAIEVPLATSLRLRELRGDCAGAWLLADGEQRAGGTVTVVARLDLEGRVIPSLVKTYVPAVSSATLAVDFVSGRAALVAESERGYAFQRIDSPTFVSESLRAIRPSEGFSLGGASHGLASSSGFSFLAEQIRALWGLERLAVSADGTFRDRLFLRVPEDLGIGGTAVYARVAYDDGSYTMLWHQGRPNERVALYYDASEQPGERQVIGNDIPGGSLFGAASSSEGFVDAQPTSAGGGSLRFSLYDRTGRNRLQQSTLSSDPSLVASSFSITHTRATFLALAQLGSGAPRLELMTYAPPRAAAVSARLPIGAGVSLTGIAAVGDRALAAWSDGALRVATVTCR